MTQTTEMIVDGTQGCHIKNLEIIHSHFRYLSVTVIISSWLSASCHSVCGVFVDCILVVRNAFIGNYHYFTSNFTRITDAISTFLLPGEQIMKPYLKLVFVTIDNMSTLLFSCIS